MPSLSDIIEALREVVQSHDELHALVQPIARFDDLTSVYKTLPVQVGEVVRELGTRGQIPAFLKAALREYPGNTAFAATAREALIAVKNGERLVDPKTASECRELVIREGAAGCLEWIGPLQPSQASRLWTLPAVVDRVMVDLEWDEDSATNRALLRLLCHRPPNAFRIEVRGNDRWIAALDDCVNRHFPTACSAQARSGWNDHAHFDELEEPRPIICDGDAIARDIHASLDRHCLNRLNDEILRALGPAPSHFHRALAEDMRRLWKAWWEILKDVAVASRFLTMLASFDDRETHRLASVGIGPDSVDRCMKRTTLLALAVACCLDDDALLPHANQPGNVASRTIQGHACGVVEVAGDPLDHILADLDRLPWLCRMVVLGNCNTPTDLLLRSGLSLDAVPPNSTGDGSWGGRAVLPPALITYDRGLAAALRKGKQPLKDHLASLLADLARADRSEIDADANQAPKGAVP